VFALFVCLCFQGDRAAIFVKESLFRLPKDPSKKIVMVGAGTGIAPFRAFMQQRAAEADAGTRVGESMLFYGCDNGDHDFLHRAEVEGYAARGLVSIYPAFFHTQLMFVQHRIREQAQLLWKSIEEEQCSLYICGGKQMAQGVEEVLRDDVLVGVGQMSTDDAEEYLQQMLRDRRYQKDVF
jgi:sulfite reductase (NADPH) flavoprotein alpha-component